MTEAVFTDAVSRNLRNGDFHLIVAGDGIREDATAIAEHIGDRGARIALVEFQRWHDNAGSQLVVPFVPFRTEVVRQRLLVDDSGAALRLAVGDDQSESMPLQTVSEDQPLTREANRAFWQSFIDRARFDHPDQSEPRHGGNNWVKINLPSPARWVNVYRYRGRAGLSLAEEPGSGLIAWLNADAQALQQDFGGEPIRWHDLDDPNSLALGIDQPQDHPDQLEWLLDASNRLVNTLRPRLATFRHSDQPTS